MYEHARHLKARGYALDAYRLSSSEETFLPLDPLCSGTFVYEAPPAAQPFARRLTENRLTAPLWRGRVGQRAQQMLHAYAAVQEYRHRMEALEALYAKIAADMDARGYDLVYVHHCRFLLSPYLLRRLRTPSVYFCQDTLRHVHEWAVETHPEYDNPRRQWGRRRFRGHLFSPLSLRILQDQQRRDTPNARAATLILANSRYSREAILRSYGVQARVCYLGVDTDFFTPNSSEERENTVLSVGSLLPTKRHDFIIDAVATLSGARRPRVQIIGYDPSLGKRDGASMAEMLRRRAAERGVDVCIQTEVSEEVLREAYRRAAVVAFAPHLEPFGFVPLEAMACGTPVVGVSEGGVRETIQGGVTGILTDRNTSEFGAALNRLLADPALAERMGRKGREAVLGRWTWPQSVNRLEQYFDLAVG